MEREAAKKNIAPAGNDPANRPEDKARRELDKGDQPQIKRRLGKFPDQPVLDHEMNVLAGFTRKIAAGEETKLAMTQRWRDFH
jgi:hypothetical protein